MKDIRLTLELTIPFDATEQQVKEWVEYQTGYRADMTIGNPLYNTPLVAEDISIEEI